MENKLNLLFDFKGHEVEIFVVNGVEYFNMNHVGNALGISNVRESTKSYNKFYKVKLTNKMLQDSVENLDVSNTYIRKLDSTGKNLGMDEVYNRKLNNAGESFLTESGVYKLVFSSRKEEAEEFQHWVFCEVLPQIRKTGGYIPVSEQDTEETIQQRAQEIANETIKYKDKEIARLKESYEQEHEARLRLIKTYNESKKEIRGLQNELDEAYVKMDLVPLMMEIQNKCEPPRELDLKSIIIKMNDTSKGYQRYKQWVEDNCMTDGVVDKECGHFLKHSKLHCFTKQYIFDLESVDALYYLALMFEEVMLNC